MKMLSEKNLSRRTFVVGGAAAAAAASLALAGCSGGGSDTKSEGEGGGEAAAPAEGGALTAACGYSSTNVDPVDLNGGSALMLAATWHVFEGLYDLDVHTYETYPALASGEPTKVSDTVYEVSLREGAKFSDGTDVTVDDVVNAFELNMAAGTIGPFLTFIDSVAKKDDTTVTITLKYPFETLLTARLSLVKIFPASLSEEDRKKMPIGSGPWKYVSINGDDGGIIEFAPNENYNGSKAATADTMTWNILLDDTARTTALQEGTVQVMENVPAVNEEQLLGAGAAVEYVQGFSQAFLMFNCQKAPFSDPRVRQAIFYAIDTEKLINNQLAGKATAVKGYLTEDHPNYHEASTIYTYDPEKAKSLLAEAGVTDLSFEADDEQQLGEEPGRRHQERPRCHRRELHHQRDEDRLGVSGRVGRRAALRRHADPGRPDLLRQRPRPADELVVRRQRVDPGPFLLGQGRRQPLVRAAGSHAAGPRGHRRRAAGAVEPVLRHHRRGGSDLRAVPSSDRHRLAGEHDHRLRAHRHDRPGLPGRFR